MLDDGFIVRKMQIRGTQEDTGKSSTEQEKHTGYMTAIEKKRDYDEKGKKKLFMKKLNRSDQ